jgi:hypothetical protein
VINREPSLAHPSSPLTDETPSALVLVYLPKFLSEECVQGQEPT